MVDDPWGSFWLKFGIEMFLDNEEHEKKFLKGKWERKEERVQDSYYKNCPTANFPRNFFFKKMKEAFEGFTIGSKLLALLQNLL